MSDQDAKADTWTKVVLPGRTDTGRGLVSTRKNPETPWQVYIAVIPSVLPQRNLTIYSDNFIGKTVITRHSEG